MSLVLHGYHYSVYLRIARLALAEKGVAYERVEVNPFARRSRRTISPSIRSAACRPWSMTASCSTRPAPSPATSTAPSPGRPCSRATPRALARMDQIIARRRFLRLLADGPAGLQSTASSGPAAGRPVDDAEVEQGLAGAAKVLAALEALVAADAFLVGPDAFARRSSSRRDDRLLHRARPKAPRCWPTIRGSRRGGPASASARASPRPIPACRHPIDVTKA